MIPKVFPNPAHQRAYENGVMAARNGKERFPPYSIDSNSSRYFRRAWLAGYDGAAERMSSNAGIERQPQP